MIPFFSYLMRTSFFKVCALVCFCTLQAVASDSDDVDSPVADFDSATLQAVTNLAIRMAINSGGTKASAATVEDNVAAILALLNQSGGIETIPVASRNSRAQPLGSFINRALGEGWGSISLPAQETGFLYMIQRAINGATGVPSPSAAVVPTLARIEALLGSGSTNSSSTVDLSAITNLQFQIWDMLDHLDENVSYYFPRVDLLVDGIDSYLRDFKYLFQDVTFNNDHEILVHDSQVFDSVSSMQYDVYGINSAVNAIAENQSAYSDKLSEISDYLRTNQLRNAHIDQEGDEADDLLESAIDYVPDGSTDYEEIEEIATDDYEDIPLPEVSDSYRPSIELSDLQSSQEDMGLSGLVLPTDHNALVTLVRNGTVLPDVEVDFGRDSALSNAVVQLGSFFSYLWGVLFSLLLGVKSVVMFRTVRLATSAMAVDEKALPVSLSYDPF